MKPGIRKKALLLIASLLVISPFLIAPLVNTIKNRNYLDIILGVDLPAGTRTIDQRRIIYSDRFGHCVHFVAVSMTLSSSFSKLLAFWKEGDGSSPDGYDLIVKEQRNDTVVWVPFGLTPQKLAVPVNLSVYYGGGVQSGLNELLADGMERMEKDKRLAILFATFEDTNAFDVRCYPVYL